MDNSVPIIAMMKEKIDKMEENLKFSMADDTLDKWKENYRKVGTGE